MGWWGCKDNENDSTWDELGDIKDFNNPSSEEVFYCLTKYTRKNCRMLEENNESKRRFKEVYLGIIIYGLEHECSFPINYLNMAKAFAGHLLNDKYYIEESGWKDIEKRKSALKEEISEIEYALTHEGKGQRKEMTSAITAIELELHQ